MAGFEEIMKLQPWLQPGHKPQRDRSSKDNPHGMGAEKLIYIYEYLTVARWL